MQSQLREIQKKKEEEVDKLDEDNSNTKNCLIQ